MSTRWYPIYQRGNPQLRVFLPNFWMKLIRPKEEQPENVVTFSVHIKMTRLDIANYLEKIYNVPVKSVRTRIALGPTKRDQTLGYVTKDDDIKMAYITLPHDVKFTFPDLCPKKEGEKEEKAMDESKKGFKDYLDRNKKRPGAPGWFSI